MTLLQILEACDNFSLLTASEKLTYFCLRADSKTPLGYLFPEVVELLQTYNGTHDHPPFEISEHRITFSPHVDDFESRSSVMKHLCETWRDAGNFSNVIGGKLWRGETFAIYEEPFREIRKDRAVFVMERVCCEIFGFVAYGVHMTMYTPDMRIWVPRRAKTKQTWPGYLDNSVAGGLPYGLTPREGLVKECMEEASMPEHIAQRATCAGCVSYFHRTSQGYLEPEVQYIYDLCLPAAHPHGSDSDQAFIPQPLDGEVESFELLTVDDIFTKMKAGEFKPNCALVLLDFFIRHGILTPEDEPNFLEIWTRAHGRHGFDAYAAQMATQGAINVSK
ncbi:hypothetical protein FRB96_004272 [Tulasnella sp. 330]|nr:hypothetical protein FRB96_004272 [Tulasnella sp. 330]